MHLASRSTEAGKYGLISSAGRWVRVESCGQGRLQARTFTVAGQYRGFKETITNNLAIYKGELHIHSLEKGIRRLSKKLKHWITI
jgi:hypothetical protein